MVADAESFAKAFADARASLAHRLRPHCGDAAEEVAREFVEALVRNGWRPTNAMRTPPWKPAKRPDPSIAERGVAAVRAALTQNPPPDGPQQG